MNRKCTSCSGGCRVFVVISGRTYHPGCTPERKRANNRRNRRSEAHKKAKVASYRCAALVKRDHAAEPKEYIAEKARRVQIMAERLEAGLPLFGD